MEPQKIHYLLEQYIAGQLTVNEQSELYQQLLLPENNDLEKVFLDYIEKGAQCPEPLDDDQLLSIFRQIVSTDRLGEADAELSKVISLYHIPLWRHWWAAASIIILLGIGLYFFMSDSYSKTRDNKALIQPVIPPGKEGAILTLANGHQVLLDSLGGGVVAYQNGMAVVLEKGQLTYDANGLNNAETVFNTMTTPKGRHFMLMLQDGTKVWLNSASSLRYPTSFTGSERKVFITGEAYFEVAKDATKPFRVMVNGKAEVEVIGTHFNINAYEDESILKTTLLEGAVKISPSVLSTSAVVLKPGQQAQLIQAQINVVDDVNVSSVVAWKDGLFNFENMSLSEVMKQLERWYDIEVVFEGAVPDVEFYGELSRTNTLTEILEAFKEADIKFRLEGRKLVILK
ncbi:FecR family protein [Flavisolibacter tropicus]|uniref:Iron dicitrate transport regulator FecR n=1 Tax=Flavisolibacter tropicus TaxID=1492898 RepID=A0A172U1H0_9BACT|nr:FecR family protein [Flavisolibacter tropicus]ANE53195.1 hypothetical protein SY85_24755 [Flavisolibacter tropicus]